MLHNSNDFTIPHPIKCDFCDELVLEWIDNVPLFNLCIPCAQMTMRRLFEDLIEVSNPNKHVSLLGIMHHGEKMPKRKPQRPLFDF